jgi:phage baseplate assembly protein W
MATSDYGQDIGWTDDLDPAFAMVSGSICLLQALQRRLETSTGSLWYDPDYGLALHQYLKAAIPHVSVIASAIETQCMRDDRVADARATVTFDRYTSKLAADVAVTSVTGETLSLTLAASDLTTTVLAGAA